MKISILSFYRRLFGVKTAFRRAVYGLWILCAIWFVGVELGTLMQCLPPQGLWDFKVTCKYFNEELFFLMAELSNCLIDVTIIILPVREIIKLQLPARNKVLLSLIFMVGSL